LLYEQNGPEVGLSGLFGFLTSKTLTKMANFIPFVSALVWLASWWWLSQAPDQWWLADIVLVIFCVVSAMVITAKAKERQWWNVAILPVISSFLLSGYLTIISAAGVVVAAVILLTLLLYIYWRFVFYYYNQPSRYTAFSLENFSFYLNFINVFLLGALAYGLRSFLQFNFWFLLAGVAVFLALVIYQTLWSTKVDWQHHTLSWLVYWLVLLEVFGVLALWPLNHNLLGVLWASLYYLLMVLFNDLLGGRFKTRRLRYFLWLVVASWLVLLLSASWL